MNALTILLTLFLASRVDLLYDNITITMAMPQYRCMSILSIIIIATLYAYQAWILFQRQNINNKVYRCMIIFTWSIMCFGAFAPYHQNHVDLISQIHVICSMSSCLLVLVVLLLYQWHIQQTSLFSLSAQHFLRTGIVLLIMMYVGFGRVNGYLEIAYSIVAGGSFAMHRYKNKRIHP